MENGYVENNNYVFVVNLPMVNGRKYTNVRVGNCDARYVTQFETVTAGGDPAKCLDRYSGQLRELVDVCLWVGILVLKVVCMQTSGG